MEKRVLLAIFLSFLVLYAFQGLFETPKPKPKTTPAAAGKAVPGKTAVTGIPAAQAGKTAGSTAREAAQQAPAAGSTALVSASQAEDIRVETDAVEAVFTNKGGELKSWKLKHYKDREGKPLELVVTQVMDRYPYPFSLKVADPAVTAQLNEALYAVQGGSAGTVIDGRTHPVTVSFEYRDASGLSVRKQFTLQPNSYVVGFQATVSRAGQVMNPAVEWGPGLGDMWNSETSRYVQKPEGILFHAGTEKVERLSAKDLSKQAGYEGTYGYAGVDDNYFMSALLFPGRIQVQYEPLAIPESSAPKAPVQDLVAYQVQPEQPDQALKVFFGPKDFDVLAGIDRNLVRAINFGWFSFLVVPLLRALKWLNGYIHNYGWSIIALTVLINLAIFPLRHKSVVSMRKMQEIQPEIKAIQARYAKFKATDPARQKMNVEMMDLYRQKGVNPASGCLPMILTLPVLYAIYSLLETAIEIRGAPFIFWIKDLSLHDPLYITPILMGISMMVQQKMTPSTADPTQQKIMLVMPIVFTVMFLWAPSGLVLYWLVSNVWAIGQQYVTNSLIGPPVVKAVRPPAERRVKKVGSGKTDAAAGGN
ncbi:MAG: membrane protein insertase YidC [Acidobacteriota bacterium]|nr:membrane protein insertase YidC [Acidobacteriota bacterium]